MPATNLRPFSTYLPPDVKAGLEKLADENDRTAAAEARRILTEHVRKAAKKG